MAEEVERLVLEPFRSIVEKGRTAIENVESEGDKAPEPMLKAAQNLVKEGERALKKIEPVSTAHFEEYGSNFIDAVKENDDISQFRSELEDLLWDFDDYLDVDEFDAAKFEELQKASRKAAPRILDIIKRMRLTAPTPAPPISPPPSEGRPASVTPQTTPSIERLMGEVNGGVGDMIGTGAGPDTGLWGASEPPSEPPPSPPSMNPWEVGRAPLAKLTLHPRDGEGMDRRRPAEPDSPTIPDNHLVSPIEGAPVSARPRGVDDIEEDERRMRAASQSLAYSEGSLSPTQSHRWTTSTQGSTDAGRLAIARPFIRLQAVQQQQQQQQQHEGDRHNFSSHAQLHDHPALRNSPVVPIPSSRLDSQNPGGGANVNGPSYPVRSTSVAVQNSSHLLSARKPSTESINSSVFDVVDEDLTGPRHTTQPMRTSSSGAYQHFPQPPPRYQPGPPPFHPTPPLPPPSRRTSDYTIRSQSSGGHTAYPGPAANGRGHHRMDEGLIPVDMEGSVISDASIPPRDPDCRITPSSSYYKLKGFCKGAVEAQRGQMGFKRIKRPMGGFSTTVVAKCTHCLFELDYKLVEQDLNNESTGNFTSNTVGFRLRVLQKSHLPIRLIEEQLYGCLFCVQQGHTLEESDATVFFSQKQLFAHMARHPRPLPRVSGLTVIEDAELPPKVQDNFDLHFPHPPTESVMSGIYREVARLPAATATETRKVSSSTGTMRLPPDRAPVLHFAVGARIVGIEFPPRYEGKWALGWHDGVRAAFETDAVVLEAPPKAEVRMQGTSSVTAVARWKWGGNQQQKGDDRWLRFDKADVIRNISWVYADHWCWSGTTGKGNHSGIFPQSHIDPASIRSTSTPTSTSNTTTSDDNASVSSWEKKKMVNPLKGFGMMRINNNNSRSKEDNGVGVGVGVGVGDGARHKKIGIGGGGSSFSSQQETSHVAHAHAGVSTSTSTWRSQSQSQAY
ncbi:hypothetical protein F5Y17DRAFT_476337 [Xylariaceae sp. FL0594]|nr:hypothetical protein F5Y17DRAFT_476337 [Xylariaceae sp. FL0594]